MAQITTREIGNSFITIDLGKIKRNIEKIQANIGEDVEIMPVLKANACGHGAVVLGKFLTEECGIRRLSVALVKEAKALREAGITGDIMVLGGIPVNNLPYAVEQDLILPLFRIPDAKLISELALEKGKKVRVHIKIDTGLGRLGVLKGEQLEELLDGILPLEGLEIEGVYTHFGEAEVEDPSFTYQQIADFNEAVEQVKARGIEPRYLHATNTPSTVRFKEARYNLVRSGLLWLGYDPCMDEENRWGLERALDWKCFLTNLKPVPEGKSMGYWRMFTAKRDSVVGIASFGYGDGYLEDLGRTGGYVLIHGKRAPIIEVCMDQTFLDVTDIPEAQVGDTITLIGEDGDEKIDAFDLEKISHNSYVTYLCNINERPVKHYIGP
ncbi:MAG: alanine racemase [Lachnospiraceae bacterium]|nr:alanine racemase [Lachnospiraceae bacterium]